MKRNRFKVRAIISGGQNGKIRMLLAKHNILIPLLNSWWR